MQRWRHKSKHKAGGHRGHQRHRGPCPHPALDATFLLPSCFHPCCICETMGTKRDVSTWYLFRPFIQNNLSHCNPCPYTWAEECLLASPEECLLAPLSAGSGRKRRALWEPIEDDGEQTLRP